MPRRCTVCDQPERHGIDEALVIFKRREQRVVEEGERAVEEAWRTSERSQEARRRAENETAGLACDV